MATRPRASFAIFATAAALIGCSTTGQPPASRADQIGSGTSSAGRAVSDAGGSSNCNLPVDPSQAQYIIGYGSLMQDDSRKRTAPQAGPANRVFKRPFSPANNLSLCW
jgi:hypothetical protein